LENSKLSLSPSQKNKNKDEKYLAQLALLENAHLIMN
jgi:hypothetical protein